MRVWSRGGGKERADEQKSMRRDNGAQSRIGFGGRAPDGSPESASDIDALSTSTRRKRATKASGTRAGNETLHSRGQTPPALPHH